MRAVAALDLDRACPFGDHLPDVGHSQKTRIWDFPFDIQRITCYDLIICEWWLTRRVSFR